MKKGALDPDEKTAKTLFSLVNLDVTKVNELGNTDKKTGEKIREDLDERALMVSRASLGLTGDLVKIWPQSQSRVDFDVDGEYLRLWVTDNIDGSKLELEQRSKGFQWFLSFYVIFNVESEEGHRDAILLLDEPGLHLHASAQENLLEVIRELSKKNQIIYTTHSPFMVDMTALDSIRTLSRTQEEGTTISDTIWSSDKEALFPLQAALGYSMSQSLFMGRNNLVVEGITDFWILSALSNMFKEAGLQSLDDRLVISPSGGAHKAALLTTMLKGQKLEIILLLDSDTEGKRARDDVVKNKILKDSNVVYVSEVFEKNKEAEIEDLFPEKFYVKYVNEAYKKELGEDEIPAPVPGKHPLIRKRLEELFESRGLHFHKHRPARLMLTDFAKKQPSDLPAALVGNFQKLFDLINSKMRK